MFQRQNKQPFGKKVQPLYEKKLKGILNPKIF